MTCNIEVTLILPFTLTLLWILLSILHQMRRRRLKIRQWAPLTTMKSEEPHKPKNKKRKGRSRRRQPIIIVVYVSVPKMSKKYKQDTAFCCGCFPCSKETVSGHSFTVLGTNRPEKSGRPGSCDAAKQQTLRLHYGAIR